MILCAFILIVPVALVANILVCSEGFQSKREGTKFRQTISIVQIISRALVAVSIAEGSFDGEPSFTKLGSLSGQSIAESVSFVDFELISIFLTKYMHMI